MLVKGVIVIIGFPCTTILLTNSASSLRILGTLNGFATTFSAMGRAAGPAAAGAVFSWGVRNGWAIAPWWMLSGIAMVGAVVPWFIVEEEGEEDEDGEEGEREGLLRGRGDCSSDEEGDGDIALLEAAGDESGYESGSDLDGKGPKGGYGTMNGSSR
jgi:hypothetical protein